MWIFGYGSLIWKADFPYVRSTAGYIKGYDRRFYQASTDHRGVPEKPGRVVTLLTSPDPEAVVWGVAYEIASSEVEAVLDQLDFRERCGYSKVEVQFFTSDPDLSSPPSHVYTYISFQSPANIWYAGEADLKDLAKVISQAVGPSGTNSDYLFRLAAATRDLAPHHTDSHLYRLEQMVRELLNPCDRTNSAVLAPDTTPPTHL